MKDVEISKKYGIPARTIADWKKADPANWRFKVYTKLKDEEKSNDNSR